MIHWITPDWPAPQQVHAASTCRTGGFSQGKFASLNLALHVPDDRAHVLANRELIKKQLSLPSAPVWLQQTHSTQVVCADFIKGAVEADASYTRRKNIVCTILTADCLPLLLCNQQGTYIAAIHAGWRGLLTGIIENTLLTAPTAQLFAWLGPAIGAECFEVGTEVRTAFIDKSPDFKSAFTRLSKEKYFADIYQLARIILKKLGVQAIYGGHYCTFTETERFYSYRRDGQTGRMASFIWLSEPIFL